MKKVKLRRYLYELYMEIHQAKNWMQSGYFLNRDFSLSEVRTIIFSAKELVKRLNELINILERIIDEPND